MPKETHIYLDGFSKPAAFDGLGKLVDKAEDADVILVRKRTPFDPRNQYLLEQFFHQGRLYYTQEEIDPVKAFAQKKIVVSIVNLERAAILSPLEQLSSAMLAEFGASEKVIAEMLFGVRKPMGKLPFELPRSQEAVEKQLEDLPYDSKDPLYLFGHGLNYPEN